MAESERGKKSSRTEQPGASLSAAGSKGEGEGRAGGREGENQDGDAVLSTKQPAAAAASFRSTSQPASQLRPT
ncbi:hypothetical protein TRV_00031 [Trichophyton verrucosum HKI 0517]|uniref:Uncharacterized protein n=1 Tax=Trichophyton verrucosum (strain HKI 0517) TaxID=663202 RepID=D4CYZ4_TRIVH|nr:uncharacterized protein TRV_00031 [Trichophyton verrucosum HKI 0517]EFE45158.1 hypothetical protein TRV_00031 [Trichophyton verrucosum HKI 0517]